MAENTHHTFFVPWFTVLLGVAAIGGVIAGNYFYGLYQMVEGDPERQETLMRFVVVSFGLAPVLLAFRWFAIRGRK
jgi:hypothetical protein